MVMAHMALYRKWRPLTFEDVVEQRHIVTTLKNSIKNNTISHAYLFCGTRGTGKTTLAKIFARAINCLDSADGSPCNKCIVCKGIMDGSIIDVIEIDAASNNGVDDVREIKEAVMYVPAVTRNKVYIIDEVHMLSTGAFNALLKTLEEPPEHVVFILATTEPHKLPATILSRCQRFDFKRITVKGLSERLKTIAEHCGVDFDDSAISLIARLSEGGMRDAISLLDQCVTLGKTRITRQEVADISGLTASDAVDSFAKAIIDGNTQLALNSIKKAMDEGRELQPLCAQLIEWFRNLMLVKTGGDALNLIEADEEEIEPIMGSAESIPFDRVLAIIKELSETENQLKWSENQRIHLEVAAVKLCSRASSQSTISDDSLISLESRLQQLENKLMNIQEGNYRKVEKASVPERTDVSEKSAHSKKELNAEKADASKSSKDLLRHRGLKQWPEIVEYVRSTGKMKVYAYLLDTQCVLMENGHGYIIVSEEDGLKKTVLSRNDSLEVIKDAILKIAGMELAIKVVDENHIKVASPEKKDDPALEKVMKFANENNIPLDIKE